MDEGEVTESESIVGFSGGLISAIGAAGASKNLLAALILTQGARQAMEKTCGRREANGEAEGRWQPRTPPKNRLEAWYASRQHSQMPELAEVEQSRRIWNVGVGKKVLEVIVPRPQDRVFRGVAVSQLQQALTGKIFFDSESRGKQMLFRFGKGGTVWVGIHLGMAGALRTEARTFGVQKHDLLILRQGTRCLVFSDRRHLGRVLFHKGEATPAWWAKLPPPILSDAFSREAVAAFLARRKGAPLKAVLLMQERFPGVGNWMADEILWRSHLHPAMRGGSLSDQQITVLHRTTRRVCAAAIEAMNENWEYPVTWLFAHRWEDGGRCPRCRSSLRRAIIGGRRTCWCPKCQPLRGGERET